MSHIHDRVGLAVHRKRQDRHDDDLDAWLDKHRLQNRLNCVRAHHFAARCNIGGHPSDGDHLPRIHQVGRIRMHRTRRGAAVGTARSHHHNQHRDAAFYVYITVTG